MEGHLACSLQIVPILVPPKNCNFRFDRGYFPFTLTFMNCGLIIYAAEKKTSCYQGLNELKRPRMCWSKIVEYQGCIVTKTQFVRYFQRPWESKLTTDVSVPFYTVNLRSAQLPDFWAFDNPSEP